jgi:2-haloacid dehalogenase
MRSRWVLFDLNGTLLDPGGVGEPLGLSREGSLAALDDAILGSMAETLTGSYRPLPDFLRAALVARAGTESGIDESMERARAMPAYPDCTPALEQLRSAGVMTGVLTNSARETAEAALGAAGLLDLFDVVAGSDEVEAFKPDPRVYRLGLARTGAAPHEVCMVASHWWDLMGAARAGMRTAWVERDGRALSQAGPAPDLRAAALDELALRLRT